MCWPSLRPWPARRWSFDPQRLAGRQSPGLAGRYSAPEGFSILLQDSGYAVRGSENGAYLLVAANDSEEPEMLPPLTVEGIPESVRFWLSDLPEAYEGGQVGSGARIGLLGNLDVFDTPFSVTSYTSELIENQQAKTVADVIQNDSSARSIASGQGLSQTIVIRGFNGRGYQLYDGLPGLINDYGSPTVQTFERAEVFKGPNTLLNGTLSAVGGAINLVPKRPTETSLTRLTTYYNYRSRFGVHADLSRRFGSKKQFGIRLNTVYHRGEAAIEDNEEELGEVALALEYRGEKLKLETILDYSNRHLDAEDQYFILSGKATSVPSVPDLEDAIQQSWERMKPKTTRALFRAEYNLSKDWTVHTAYGARDHKEYWLRTIGLNLDSNGDFNTLLQQYTEKVKSYTQAAGIRGKFETGGIIHQISLESMRSNTKNRDIFKSTPKVGFKSNLYDPVFVTLPEFDRIRNPPKSNDFVESSIAITDTMSFLDERILLTAGIRRQNVESKNFNRNTGIRIRKYDKSANTPAVGLLVKPWNFMSIYGNYIEGLEAGPTAPTRAVNAGEIFPPSETEQIEFGVKFDLDGLGLTAGVFQIEKPSGITDENRRFSVDGEQRNRGFELNAFGELRPNLRLLGGFTYINSKLTRTQGGKFDGNDTVGVPDLTAVLNLEWDTPVLPGLTLTARAEHIGSQYIKNDNSLDIPSYELYGLGARYKRTMGDKEFTFRINVDNLLNEDYWTTWTQADNILFLGAPRRINLSFSMDF